MDVESLKLAESNEFSHMFCKRQRTHVVLPAIFMTKLEDGIKDSLEKNKGLFDKSLEGVVVAYDKIQLGEHAGRLLFDQPYSHWDVDADVYYFRPTIGCILQARINSIYKSHIGCLAHECFNLSLPTTDLTPMEIGQDILCEITDANLMKRFKLRGRITEKCYELMKNHGMIAETSHKSSQEENSSSESGICVDEDINNSNKASSNGKPNKIYFPDEEECEKGEAALLKEPSRKQKKSKRKKSEQMTEFNDKEKSRKRKKSGEFVKPHKIHFPDEEECEDALFEQPPHKKRKLKQKKSSKSEQIDQNETAEFEQKTNYKKKKKSGDFASSNKIYFPNEEDKDCESAEKTLFEKPSRKVKKLKSKKIHRK